MMNHLLLFESGRTLYLPITEGEEFFSFLRIKSLEYASDKCLPADVYFWEYPALDYRDPRIILYGGFKMDSKDLLREAEMLQMYKKYLRHGYQYVDYYRYYGPH